MCPGPEENTLPKTQQKALMFQLLPYKMMRNPLSTAGIPKGFRYILAIVEHPFPPLYFEFC